MQVSIEKSGEAWAVAPAGRIDASTFSPLSQKITSLIDGGARLVALDLSRVQYLSSAGVRLIIQTAKKLHELGGKLALCGAAGPVKDTLASSGLLQSLPCHGTLREAIQSISPAPPAPSPKG